MFAGEGDVGERCALSLLARPFDFNVACVYDDRFQFVDSNGKIIGIEMLFVN